MDKKNVTTALELEGFKIVKTMGIVRGITVRSRNVFANIGASFQSLVGGNISLYASLCEKAREDAFELMLQHADEMNANAIICMRYDANEIGPGITEVLAYGTAVTVEKK
ncbi:MAG: YbjQ family protein [Bacteroidia bacterium]